MPSRNPKNHSTRFKKSNGVSSYQDQYNKSSISTLKKLLARLERGELLVEDFGYWEALPGKMNFRIVVKDYQD